MDPARRRSVVDVALQEGAMVSVEAGTRARVLDRLRLGDLAFRHLTRAAAVFVLLLLSGVIITLVQGSLLALQTFGFSFLTTDRWNPVTENFGALAPIYGTLVTSFIAMLIAVPVGLMIAFFLTELCPQWLRRPIGIAIELLAGIPSIIYGIWGLFVFAPFLQETLQPFLINTLGNVPVIAPLFSGPPYGIGMLTAGLILTIMVLPFVTSISRDVFDAVPVVLKEAAYGVGCTTWEVVRYVVLPYARVGVIGGVMLGLGRALGETIAVAIVSGSEIALAPNVYGSMTTIAATIVNQLDAAASDPTMFAVKALAEAALVLMVITLLVNLAARLLVRRVSSATALPVGAGF